MVLFTLADQGLKYKLLKDKHTWKEAINMQDDEWYLPSSTELEPLRECLHQFANYWTFEESADDKHFAITYEPLYGHRGYQIKRAFESVVLFPKK